MGKPLKYSIRRNATQRKKLSPTAGTAICISAAETSNCIIATETVTCTIATERSTNITVTESTTCITAMEPQALHNCNRLCHLHNGY